MLSCDLCFNKFAIINFACNVQHTVVNYRVVNCMINFWYDWPKASNNIITPHLNAVQRHFWILNSSIWSPLIFSLVCFGIRDNSSPWCETMTSLIHLHCTGLDFKCSKRFVLLWMPLGALENSICTHRIGWQLYCHPMQTFLYFMYQTLTQCYLFGCW